MITKIFYSLVLFPKIKYQEKLESGFFLHDIEEVSFGTIKTIFIKNNQFEEIIFTYFELENNLEKKYKTKNWFLNGKENELLREIYELLINFDNLDFNFFKSKDFYNMVPFGTVLNITSKCNLFCNYCFNDYDYPLDSRNTRDTLGIDDFKKIINELYENGTRDIILTGGEPFVCNFMWELLDYLKAKKIFARINTNGTLLSDNTLQRLNENYSIVLMVSMHEFNNYDYFKLNEIGAKNIYGIEGLKKWENKYEQKVKQLKKLKDYENITLDFLTILTPKNILYLEKIYNYVLNNFKINDWHLFRLFSTNTTSGISREMITLAIHKIYKLNNKYNRNFKIVDAVPFCVTKNIEIAREVIDGELSKNHNVKTIITAEGNVQIMSAFDSNLGNIFEHGIKKLWKMDFVQKKLNNGFLPKECYDCLYKDECMGGSRMVANMENGSYGAWDPLGEIKNKVKIIKK